MANVKSYCYPIVGVLQAHFQVQWSRLTSGQYSYFIRISWAIPSPFSNDPYSLWFSYLAFYLFTDHIPCFSQCFYLLIGDCLSRGSCYSNHRCSLLARQTLNADQTIYLNCFYASFQHWQSHHQLVHHQFRFADFCFYAAAYLHAKILALDLPSADDASHWNLCIPLKLSCRLPDSFAQFHQANPFILSS